MFYSNFMDIFGINFAFQIESPQQSGMEQRT